MFFHHNSQDLSLKEKSLPYVSLLFSLGVVIYVAVVAAIMTNAENLFGEKDSILAPMAFLLLFSVSAAVVGSLVFGYPAMLFLSGQRREGVLAAGYTIAWLTAETILAVFTAAMVSVS